MKSAISALFRSRKFLLAVFGVAQSVALHYLSIPKEVYLAIDVLIMVLINAIATEDAAEKRAGGAEPFDEDFRP